MVAVAKFTANDSSTSKIPILLDQVSFFLMSAFIDWMRRKRWSNYWPTELQDKWKNWNFIGLGHLLFKYRVCYQPLFSSPKSKKKLSCKITAQSTQKTNGAFFACMRNINSDKQSKSRLETSFPRQYRNLSLLVFLLFFATHEMLCWRDIRYGCCFVAFFCLIEL